MTQLIVSVDNQSMIEDIKNAIMMIKGVISVNMGKNNLNQTTLTAIEDAMNGNTIRCATFDDYKKLVANLDNV